MCVIDLDLAPELPPVRGDRVQLQQVLLNLVLNGMEAMGPHGEGRRIVLQTLQADGAVRVSVRDQGPGIPGDTLSRIFETFYTTKSERDGDGTGDQPFHRGSPRRPDLGREQPRPRRHVFVHAAGVPSGPRARGCGWASPKP